MPITIVSTPQLVEPVYNPIYFNLISDKTNEEAFNFRFDIYANGNYITPIQLPAIPGTSGVTFSPASVLESYLSFDKSHNYIGSSANTNCILNYEVIFSEEYVNYWNFTTEFDGNAFSINGVGLSSQTQPHGFVTGDTIYIQQSSGFTTPQMNGVQTVIGVPDPYSLIVNYIPYNVTLSAQSGTAVYSDKRKTIYGGYQNFLQNPTFQYLGGDNFWTSDINPGCSSYFEITVADKLVFSMPDVSCQDTFTIAYTGGTFTPGQTYTVGFNVDNINNPSSSPQYVQARLGGNVGGAYGGAGSYSSEIICGPSGVLELIGYFDADTSGFGAHSFSLDFVTVTTDSSFSGYAFNASLQYEQVPDWDFEKYDMGPLGNARFLSNRPSYVETRLEDRGTIGFMTILTSTTSNYYMISYSTRYDGSPTIPLVYPLAQISSGTTMNSTGNIICEFGCYPWNLNQLSQQIYMADAVTSGDKEYFIQIAEEPDPIGDPGNIVGISERRYFNLDIPCSPFENIRFMFLNTLGQFDFFTANLVSRKTVDVTRSKFRKTLSPTYTLGDRGSTIASVNSQEKYIVTSNWMDDDTAEWLIELFDSPEVYVVLSTGELMPIDIENSSISPGKSLYGDMINYTFNYTKSVKRNRQRN